MQVMDPATDKPLRDKRQTSLGEARARAMKVSAEARRWRGVPWAQKQRCLQNVAARLRDKAQQFALLMASEMGKPVSQGRAECEKCAWVCEYYAEQGESFLKAHAVETNASRSFVTFEPLGVVLAIMPWNFPFWQVFRCAAPALAAGNGVLLKHASNVPACALQIEQLLAEAGFPDDLFAVIFTDNTATQKLIESPSVHAVSFTGSVSAGRTVAQAAGRALKKCVLELGGSDPYVVLADADAELAAAICVESRLINSGQSCIAAKRFIVVRRLAREFRDAVVQLMKGRTLGDPMDDETDLGPLARVDLRDKLHRQVHESVEKGALLLLGGHIPNAPGAWYPPTVLANVRPEMPAYHEELFGPVAAIIEVADDTEALRIANDTRFGLGAAVLTRDRERGERLARDHLDAGSCFVNTFVKSDPRLPFGGIKESGYGRELGAFGIREFVNIKTVYVR